MLVIMCKNVLAVGNVSLVTSKTNVNVGDEFTVNVNLSGVSIASLTVRVNVDTTKVQYIKGSGNSNFRNGKVIYTWTDPNGGETPISSRNNCNIYI